MRSKIGTTNDQSRIKMLVQDLTDITVNEKQYLLNRSLEIINQSIYSDPDLNINALKKLFNNFYEKSNSKEERLLIKNTWKSNISIDDKVNFIAKLYIENIPIPSEIFIGEMIKFMEIIQNDTNLTLFLNDPQQYIYTQPNLTAYQQQILKQVATRDQFNNLPSIGELSITNAKIETPITYYTQQLNFSSYTSTDAVRFEQCINEEVKADILAKSKKDYIGPSVTGMGVLPSYNRKAIEQTAKVMKQMKQGACHNFAQLAADHLLTLMDEGKIAQQHIKMVSHNNGINSHTFLLLGHDSDDLTNLSHCLIIDGWAVAMGHQPTSGVFTEETYPFPSMTSNLVLCYDNYASILSQSSSASSRQSLDSELGQRLSQSGFFSRRSEPLSKNQQAVVNFLNGLISLTDNSIKKALFNDLINALKDGTMQPPNVAKRAALAFHARIIEINNDGDYVLGSIGAVNESALPLFNNPAVVKLWTGYAKTNGLVEEPVSNVTNTLLDGIVRHLSGNDGYTSYHKPEQIRPT